MIQVRQARVSGCCGLRLFHCAWLSIVTLVCLFFCFVFLGFFYSAVAEKKEGQGETEEEDERQEEEETKIRATTRSASRLEAEKY